MQNVLAILPLLTKYGALFVKYGKYIPLIAQLVATAEDLISGVKRGEEKKALVLSALTAVVRVADDADIIETGDAEAIIKALVEAMNAFEALRK